MSSPVQSEHGTLPIVGNAVSKHRNLAKSLDTWELLVITSSDECSFNGHRSALTDVKRSYDL